MVLSMQSPSDFRRDHGDRFLVRLFWHSISGLAAALALWAIQTYFTTNQATAAANTERITRLEIVSAARTEELAGIQRELHRMNETLERLRK